MRTLRYFVIVCIAVLLAFISPVPAHSQDESREDAVVIAVFVREGCTHCKDEEDFLEALSVERDDIAVGYYRLENDSERAIWEEFTTRLGITKVTPITVVGVRYLIGFASSETTGQEIRNLIDEAKRTGTSTDIYNPSLIARGQESSSCPEDGSIPCTLESTPAYTISLPLIGKIDTTKYPLFVLSAILGFFDGFNPCAMWVLVTFLVILMQVGSRRKMFLFAGIFIIAESIMYALILTVWYKTWDFVQLDTIVTPLVGGVSIVGGLFFLREWRKKELECRVTNVGQRTRTRQKIQDLATNKFTLVTFLGILGIAFSVNIIEFACSIGIPQAFTKILELNQLSLLSTTMLIAVYIFFYMVDDLLVFGIALYGIDKLHIATRYSKFSNLIGGIVMILLGLTLIFRSHLLQF